MLLEVQSCFSKIFMVRLPPLSNGARLISLFTLQKNHLVSLPFETHSFTLKKKPTDHFSPSQNPTRMAVCVWVFLFVWLLAPSLKYRLLFRVEDSQKGFLPLLPKNNNLSVCCQRVCSKCDGKWQPTLKRICGCSLEN